MAIPSGAVLTNDRCLNCLPLTIAIAVFSCGCQQQKTRIPWRKTRYLQTKQQRPSLTSHPFQSPTQRAAEPLLTAHCSLCIQAIDAGERRRFPLCVLREKVHRAGRASLRTENCAKKSTCHRYQYMTAADALARKKTAILRKMRSLGEIS